MVTYQKWVERSESPAWLQGAQWQTQIDLHRPIVEAMQRRDQDAMAAALLAHDKAIIEHLDKREVAGVVG